jgi:hypothetical protein
MAVQQRQLERRVALARERLESEFPDIPRDEVGASLSIAVSQLLDDARVFDYVPILALRSARERLEARQDAAASRAA